MARASLYVCQCHTSSSRLDGYFVVHRSNAECRLASILNALFEFDLFLIGLSKGQRESPEAVMNLQDKYMRFSNLFDSDTGYGFPSHGFSLSVEFFGTLSKHITSFRIAASCQSAIADMVNSLKERPRVQKEHTINSQFERYLQFVRKSFRTTIC